METFDNNVVNVTVLVELALALFITRGGALTSLLATAPLSGTQWLIGAAPAVLLLVLWELGKLIARRGAQSAKAAMPEAAFGDTTQAAPA
jgi:Ca2+-transporting ATPase